MKPQPQLAFMMKGQMFDGYLLVKAASQRTSSNGSKYLDLTLCDITGEVNAKMWDSMTLPTAIAEPVRVRGMMQEYNNRAQLRIDKMRDVTENDDLDLSLLTPVAPYPATEMMELINARIEKMQDESLKALLKARIEQCGPQLMYYPAASKLHHAEKAGLLHHTSTMLRMA